MATKIVPLHNRVVLKRSESERRSAGGLHLPDSARELSLVCTVVAVGRGRVLESGKLEEPTVKAGDTVVLAGRWTAGELRVDGEDYICLAETEIAAILEEA